MREELDIFIGAALSASCPKRKAYRNGSYTRDLVTAIGRIDELKVHRDREDQFHTQVFDRYSRYEPQVAQGLTEMFVAWVSMLQDLRTRAATRLDLIVTDGHDGLLTAVTHLLPATPRQRCLLHKQ